MGFFDWVGGLFKSGAGKIADLLKWVPHALQVLWNLVRGIGVNVGRAWTRLYQTIGAFTLQVEALAHAAYVKLRQVITQTIPAFARNTLVGAFRAASGLVGTLKAYVLGALQALSRYLSALVAELKAWTAQAVRWLTGIVGELRGVLSVVARRVDALLSAPERLVTWILAPLVKSLVRFADDNAQAIAEWLVPRAVKLVLRSIPRIEQTIADLF